MRHLRLPQTLAFTVIQGAFAGAIACSSSSGGEVDASAKDARAEAETESGVDSSAVDSAADVVASDGPLDCGDAGMSFCGPTEPDASCPGDFCGFTCPPGCEPFL